MKIKFNQWTRLEKLKKKLSDNPYAGKRLGRDLFEKKWGPFRIYYIIIKDILLVFLLEFSDKKEQSKIVSYILANWDQLIEEIRKSFS
jgi:mRNA-degrading endonuclease RelE of RelBE toxin-antitoxin system